MLTRKPSFRFIVIAITLFVISVAASSAYGQRFGASIDGPQETPPSGSVGVGYGNVVLSADQTMITVNMGFTGLGTAASAAHIHTGAIGVAGPVTFGLSGLPAATSGVIPQQSFAISPAQVADLLAGNMYFNIHTGGFPGGEIRGQILPPTCTTAGPIEVHATAATMGPTAYATTAAAFTAINTGVHQGAIDVEVCGNTTETASASLTASGVTGAVYTSVNVFPVGGARTITGSIVGAIIKLTGADNVTVDGRIGGTGRNLTVTNSSTASATAAIWLTSTGVAAGATNNVIRNLELACGATQNTSTSSTFGIIMASNNTTIGTASGGDDNDGNSFIANRIIRTRYGIATRGQTTNNNQVVTITDNIVGPTAFGTDQIGKAGIFMQSDTGAIVSRNTVQFVGGDFANTTGGADRAGIAIGSESTGSTTTTTITSGDYTVTRNFIHDIIEERTFSSAGIILGTTRSGVATNNLVANNFIYNVRANGTAGDQFYGIAINAGHTDSIVNNSISITGDMDPGASSSSTNFGNGIRINAVNGTNNVNFRVMNNSIYLDATSNNATTHFYAITLPSAAYVFGTGGLNFNNYYINVANAQLRTGGLATVSGAATTTEFLTLANWQAALTAPQDAASIQADPNFASVTSDLHINSLSPNIDVGATIAAVTVDIDNQARPNGAAYDIGADEFYAVPGTVEFSATSYTGLEGALVTITVNRVGGSSGAISVNYATGGGTATGGADCTTPGNDYISASGTLNWADTITTPQTFNVQLCNDAVIDTELVQLTLSGGTAVISGTNPVDMNITDNPPGTIQFSSVTYSGDEGTTATITATRTGGTSGIVSVDFATSSGGGNPGTSGVSCTAGVDYVDTMGTLSWGNNDGANKTFTVQVCSDILTETTETAIMTLSNPIGGVAIGANNPATLNIRDVASQYCNADGAITIPAGAPGTTIGPATPYPSVINVAGSVGTITGMRVSLYNLTHTFGNDIDVLLVGPGGQKFILMSDVGDSAGFDAAATMTFSDSGVVIPTTGAIPSGTYLPTDITSGDTFVAPAPVGPYISPAPVGAGTLNGTFSGGSANGTWSLYVVDDVGGDVGSIASWCLEFTTLPPTPGTIQFSSTTYSGNEGTMATITATRTGGNSGVVQVNYTMGGGTATTGATCTGSTDYLGTSGQLQWLDMDSADKTFMIQLCSDAVLDDLETIDLTLSNVTGGATIGANNPATFTITDVPPPLSGTYTVGTMGNYPSLTNNGGIFQALNTSGASGNIDIEIISDLTGELGTHALNELPAGINTLIYPTCSTVRTVTGSNTGGLIRLNGADNVTINGDNSCPAVVGGNSALRNLTFTNTDTTVGTPAVISVGSNGANGAMNNTIQNVNVDGDSPTTTLLGISLGGATPGSPGIDNDGNSVINCRVRRALFGVYSAGESVANPNTGTLIQENDISSTGADRVQLVGILLFNDDGAQIVENAIGGLDSSASADVVGIGLGVGAADGQFSTTAATSGGITNALVARNRITGVTQDNTWGAAGIAVAGDTAGPNTIVNNMISGVISDATSPDIVAGIFVAGVTGSDTRLYHNSISMTGDRGATGGQQPSYGIAITGTDPTVELKNNIFYTTQIASGGGVNAKSYAIGMVTTTFANLNSDYNDFWSTGVQDGGFRSGSLASAAGTDYGNVFNWLLAVSDDNASQEVDPAYINPANDLHLNAMTTSLLTSGITGFAMGDHDSDPRPAANPEIGADELVQSDMGNFPAGVFYNAITANGDQLAGLVFITNSITLNGIVNTGNFNTISIGCNASVVNAGATNYVVGTVSKDYCGTGTFSYPVGTTPDGMLAGLPPEYTPVTANVTGGTFPSILSARVFDNALVGFDPAQSLSRNWQLEELGDLTADLSFTYLAGDVNGTEANYRVWRRQDNGFTQDMCGAPCVTSPVLGPAVGVTDFSRWTGSGPLAPTAARVSLGGRVQTSDGGGIRNARIVVTGNTLMQPRVAQTGSFGYYRIDDLQAGETYVVTINSKRYTFQVPSRVISLVDNVTDVDFIADPLE